MSRILVLLAGYPACGKSTFSKQFISHYPDAFLIAPDDIKEEYWDMVGFNNAEEKATLEHSIWKTYYARMSKLMEKEVMILTDYPFSNKQKPMLTTLTELYEYRCITVRFIGDLQLIYKRSWERDQAQTRHLGHLMNHYHKGDVLLDRSKIDVPVTLDLLTKRCVSKGYGDFVMGDLVEVDASHIEKISFENLLNEVSDHIDSHVDVPRTWIP